MRVIDRARLNEREREGGRKKKERTKRKEKGHTIREKVSKKKRLREREGGQRN